MIFEFNTLKKSLELELAYEDRTIPVFLLIAFGVLTFLFLSKSVDYKLLLLLATLFLVGAVFITRRKTNSNSASDLIKEHTIGKLSVSQDPFEILDESKNVIIDDDFNGSVTMKCAGYYKEVIGQYEEEYTISYGTKNQIIVKDSKKEKKYLVFLEDIKAKEQFQQLIEVLHSKNIEVKEFTRGERTYLGKKLTYKEIQEFKARKNE